MRHKTRAVAARLFLGAFLLSSPLLAGCGGGSSSQANQIIKGASITKEAKVVASTGTGMVAANGITTTYLLQDGDGLYYAPNTLDPALQKDGLKVQFTAIVVDPVVPADGFGIPITITSIHAL